MTKETAIKLFEEKQVRSVWDAEQEKWYISIVDVIAVLTESVDPNAYWRKLKQRLKEEGNETVTNCHGLKMQADTTKKEAQRENNFDPQNEKYSIEESLEKLSSSVKSILEDSASIAISFPSLEEDQTYKKISKY